jgi:cytochrome c
MIALLALPGACGGGARGAGEQSLAKAATAAPQGQQLYAAQCAHCHGEQGEGTANGPPLMGPGALPVRRQKQADLVTINDPVLRRQAQRDSVPGAAQTAEARRAFQSAADIHAYLASDHRKLEGVTALDEPDQWAVLTYVLTAHGLEVPEGGLTVANAGGVRNP